jgi:hypothetical protein
MYSLSIPVAQLRNKMRQEFERHRYVNQIGVVDVLLTQSHAEFQVSPISFGFGVERGSAASTTMVYDCKYRGFQKSSCEMNKILS